MDKWIESQWETKDMKEIKPFYSKNGRRNRGNEYYRMRKNTKLKQMHIVRYADDFKIFTNNRENANKIFNATKMWLKERLDLDISPEKSKITDLRKSYTEFLGFKLKLQKKSQRYTVISHISDKAKNKISEQLREQIKKIQHSGEEFKKQINYYNSKCLGIHNYYKIATHCSKDFTEIAYVINKALKNRLRPKRDGTNLPQYVKERYGDSKQLRYVGNNAIIPIGYIKTKNPMDIRASINKYTKQGREIIHKNLSAISDNVMLYMLENPVMNRTVEYNDNRISLYCGQNGKCGITKEYLEIGNIHCHHKNPRNKITDDSYANLILIKIDVHMLIHAKDRDTFDKYITSINLTDKKQCKLVDELREKLGLPPIERVLELTS